MSRNSQTRRIAATRSLRIAVTLALAVQLAASAPAQTSVVASQDNWVGRDAANTSHPTSTTLALRGHENWADAKEVFIRFDVPSGSITGASLSLYRQSIAGANTVEIATVNTTSDVDAFTWNNRPTSATVVLTAPIASGSGSESYDLSAIVQPGAQLTLRLRLLNGSSSYGWGWFLSREHSDTANRPYLVLHVGDNTGEQYCAETTYTCPCFAVSAAGEGCPNSTGVGATLEGSGNASVSNSTFSLTACQLPQTVGLFIEGHVPFPNGGHAVGEGRLCLNPQKRYQPQVIAGGCATRSNFQSTFPGDTVNYQFWFRDPSNQCNGGGYNFSPAWRVTWMP